MLLNGFAQPDKPQLEDLVMRIGRLVGMLLFALFFALPLATKAQQETATITGEVKDATGAGVPKATVTVTNTETGISLRSETNEQGVYLIPSLKPGPYSLAFEKAGFKKALRSGVT